MFFFGVVFVSYYLKKLNRLVLKIIYQNYFQAFDVKFKKKTVLIDFNKGT